MKRTLIPAVLAATVLMTVAVPLSASAHDRTATVDCASASVALTNYDSGATAAITLDGVSLHDGTFNGRLVQSWPTVGNSEHTFTVTVRSNDGSRYNFDYSETTTGCFVPPVVPERPDPRVTVETVDVVDCDAQTVTTTDTESVFDVELVDNVWVELAPVVTVTSTDRPTTAADNCVPPVTPSPTPEPTHPASVHRLATTGLDDGNWYAIGAALLGLLVGIPLVAKKVRKGKHA